MISRKNLFARPQIGHPPTKKLKPNFKPVKQQATSSSTEQQNVSEEISDVSRDFGEPARNSTQSVQGNNSNKSIAEETGAVSSRDPAKNRREQERANTFYDAEASSSREANSKDSSVSPNDNNVNNDKSSSNIVEKNAKAVPSRLVPKGLTSKKTIAVPRAPPKRFAPKFVAARDDQSDNKDIKDVQADIKNAPTTSTHQQESDVSKSEHSMTKESKEGTSTPALFASRKQSAMSAVSSLVKSSVPICLEGESAAASAPAVPSIAPEKKPPAAKLPKKKKKRSIRSNPSRGHGQGGAKPSLEGKPGQTKTSKRPEHHQHDPLPARASRCPPVVPFRADSSLSHSLLTSLHTEASASGRKNKYLSACLGVSTYEEPLPPPGVNIKFNFYTVFLKRNAKGGIGLRLKNLDGHAAVGGFSELFLQQHGVTQAEMTGSSDGCSVSGSMSAKDIKIDDIIVAVGSLDAVSPRQCSFDKVVRHLVECNSSRDPRRGLGGVGHAASSSNYHSWDSDETNVQNKSRSSQHALLQDTICIRFARAAAASQRPLSFGFIESDPAPGVMFSSEC